LVLIRSTCEAWAALSSMPGHSLIKFKVVRGVALVEVALVHRATATARARSTSQGF
jgi:hypothetical protein